MLSDEDDSSKCVSRPFKYQVAGHYKIIQHPYVPSIILKPNVPREVLFYRTLLTMNHPLLKHVPLTYECTNYLAMEDLTYGMKSPCIMDVKIGAQLYDVDARPEKIASRRDKSKISTSGMFGFRICGILKDSRVCFVKSALSRMSFNEISSVLKFFFGGHPKRQSSAIQALMAIRSDVAKSNTRLISSSILLIYDSAGEGPTFCKMIDFSHSHVLTKPSVDLNYLNGLDSFIRFMRRLL